MLCVEQSIVPTRLMTTKTYLFSASSTARLVSINNEKIARKAFDVNYVSSCTVKAMQRGFEVFIFSATQCLLYLPLPERVKVISHPGSHDQGPVIS